MITTLLPARRKAKRDPWDTPRILTISTDTWEPWMSECCVCTTCNALVRLENTGQHDGHEVRAARCEPEEVID